MKQFLNVFSKKQFGVWEVILSTVKIQSFWKFWSMPRLHLVVLEQAFWQWYYFFEYVVLKTYKVSMWNQINGTLCISLQRILTRFFNHLIAYHAFLWFCHKSMFLSPFCKNFTHPEKLHLGIRFVFLQDHHMFVKFLLWKP